MKEYLNAMKAFRLTSLIACLVVLGATCNPGTQRAAYNTLYSVEKATVTAYDAYLDQIISGKVGTNDLARVSRDFNAFQISMQAAIELAAFNTNAVAPPNIVSNSAAIIGEIKVAR